MVARLLQRAFGGTDEVRLVAKLRKGGFMAGEMVLPVASGIAGYYALSRMAAPKGWLCLAPVAIDPDWQGRGLGRRMIGMLAEWARHSNTPVVVLGAVDFYQRAGFSATDASALTSRYPIENTLLAGVTKPAKPQALVYPKPFEGL